MEELIKRLERVIATGAPDKDGLHPISAETVLEVVKQLSEHGTNLAEVGTNCISRRSAIDALRGYLVGKRCTDDGTLTCRLIENEAIKQLPLIQPEIVRCKDCKHGVLDDGFPHQYFCVFKGDEWNNADYFCGHAKRREVTT